MSGNIVALVSDYQALTDKHIAALEASVAEVEAENARLREALEKYGWHSPGCKARATTKGSDCDCGFTAALSKPEDR